MFIGRRPDGSIYGAWSVRQPDDADHPGMEEVAEDHPELVEFLKPEQKSIDKLKSALDALLEEQSKRDDAPQAVKDYVDSLVN